MKFLRRIFRSPVFWVVLILFIVLRITATRIILQKANEILADFSPIFQGHVEDLSISILRGAYRVHGFELGLKDKKPQRFISVEDIDVSVAWREIFNGHIVTDISLDEVKITLTKSVLDAFKEFKKQAEKDSKDAASKIFPLRVERLDIKDSSFEFTEMLSIPETARWRLTDIQGRASNLTPTESTPLTLATIQGKLFDTTVLRVVGRLDLLAEPPKWDIDLQLKDFNLTDANSVLGRTLPLTITKGTFDLYSEVISQKGKIEGYAKPFLHKADIVADKERFKGFRHGAIEISTAAANIFFQSAKDRTVATKINFSYDDSGLKINSAKAFMDALKNGFQDEIPEGIDDEISISVTNGKGKGT